MSREERKMMAMFRDDRELTEEIRDFYNQGMEMSTILGLLDENNFDDGYDVIGHYVNS